MGIAFLARFALGSVLYLLLQFCLGVCPALKSNKIIKLSWILTAEGQHTTSVHQCVVLLSAAMLSKNT